MGGKRGFGMYVPVPTPEQPRPPPPKCGQGGEQREAGGEGQLRTEEMGTDGEAAGRAGGE